MAALYPYLLHLMEEYVFTPYEVNTSDIKSLSEIIYYDAVKLNNYESLCYAIFLQFDLTSRLKSLKTIIIMRWTM